MTSKLDMVKARNLSIISVIAAGALGAGLMFTGVIGQPETVEGVDVTQIYSGRNTSFVLDNEGTLWAKGVNSVGQLGVGDFINKTEWTPVVLPEGNKVESVSVGDAHTAMLTAEQEIYTFGDNRSGILGNGTNSISLSPTRVVASHTYNQIAAGEGFVVALGTDGKLYSWGKNDKGQLGVGDNKGRGEPTLVEGVTGNIVSIKAGKDFALVLTDDGKITAWGANDKGQLGMGDKEPRLSPTLVPLEEQITFINTNLTSSSVVALAADGRMFTWGANDKAQLGNGSDWREEIRLEAERVANEKQRVKDEDEARKERLIGECVVEKTEEWKEDNPPVWQKLPKEQTPTISNETPAEPTDEEEEPPVEEEEEEPKDEWGWVTPETPDFKPECERTVSETFEETDTSDIVAREIKEPELKPDGVTPEHVGGGLRFIYASVGSQNGSAVSSGRKLFTWGADSKGQNGNNIEDDKTHTQVPKLIQGENDGVYYSKAEVSNGWSAGLTSSGNITVWGTSASGALGSAGDKAITPVTITSDTPVVFSNIVLGPSTGYGTSSDSVNYSWGGNNSGVLGYETAEAKSTEFKQLGSNLTAIAPSGAAVIGLGANKNLYGWGTDRENAFGEGTANETTQQTPRRLQQITKFSSVSVGDGFTSAVDLNGKVWVWGSNSSGVSGTTPGGNLLYPTKVEVSEEFTFNKVQATASAVYAFSDDGRMISWGAGRGFTEIELPEGEFASYSTVEGMTLLSSEGEMYRTTYSPEVASSWTELEEPAVDVFVKAEGSFNAVSQSVTGQSIAQLSDDTFLIWGYGLSDELEPAQQGTFMLPLSLPKIEHISLSSTHYMMFDENKILWMWGEEPSGTFKNKGYVSVPQSNIFTPKKETK